MSLIANVKKHLKLPPMLAVSLIITSPAVAEIQRDWQDKQGNIHQQKPWQKSKNNFGAMLFATNDLPAFEKAWYHPASASYTPQIPTTNKAKADEFIHLIIIFSGCKADTQGNCQLKGSMKIIDPKGKQLADEKVDFFQNKQPKAGITTASPTMLKFGIEKQDTKGSYQFNYVITDANANTTVNLSRTITFTK